MFTHVYKDFNETLDIKVSRHILCIVISHIYLSFLYDAILSNVHQLYACVYSIFRKNAQPNGHHSVTRAICCTTIQWWTG